MAERRQVGDRVIVAWHRKEYDATIKVVGRVGYIVETDETYGDGLREMHRHEWEIFDERSEDA